MQQRNGARETDERLASEVAKIRTELHALNEQMAAVPQQMKNIQNETRRLGDALGASLASEGAAAYLRALHDLRHSDEDSLAGW